MSTELTTLCHLQQDCGDCVAFETAFSEYRGKCKYRDKEDCLNLENECAVCRVCECSTFDRNKILTGD